ncbi:hypothetical protein RI129_003784 [Pyrocoelia pectoralis]|uniref:Homeobox domain-containing protein n=1 Tax=Pyrocoelia pectoralis TaxID=417401 RepID=A0AAN7ZNE1_9COLE
MTAPRDDEKSEQNRKLKFNFSIDHILNRAGCSKNEEPVLEQARCNITPFTWMQCTRYCPPKLQRISKREGTQRRQLGKHPRIPFTTHQLSILEEKFRQSPYLSSSEVTQVSRFLELADIRVKIWFQNRRARERREKLQLDLDQKKCLSKSIEYSSQPPTFSPAPNFTNLEVMWASVCTNKSLKPSTSTTNCDSYT